MKLLEQNPDGFDLLTWVPTAWQRCAKRGYDQTELIARAVAGELGMKPVKLLKKVRNTPPQSGITGHAERRANVVNAYRLTGKQPVRGKKILLIDDIITTGATAGECARVLLTAGAEEICCGAVAVTRQRAKTR
jgi:predicted amidophosphoribosyltransferase